MLNKVNDWAVEGSLVKLSYDIGNLYVAKEDFDRAFGAIINASYEDVLCDFALSDKQLARANDWKIEGDLVKLSYDAGDLYVSKEDFDRAFGAIINAPYEAVRREFAVEKKEFAVSSVEETIESAKTESLKTANSNFEPNKEHVLE